MTSLLPTHNALGSMKLKSNFAQSSYDCRTGSRGAWMPADNDQIDSWFQVDFRQWKEVRGMITQVEEFAHSFFCLGVLQNSQDVILVSFVVRTLDLITWD